MTIDNYISQRNEIQLAAEAISDEVAADQWRRLGVANRHIERILAGELNLTPAVEEEIQRCLNNA